MSVQIITSRHTVNRLSDFQLDMVLEKDGVLYMPASFVMAFYVDEWSCEDAYVASRLDGQTTNCEISGSIISVYFNSPGFTCGQLKCRVIDSVDNAAVTDGTLDTCTPLTLPVEIVATAGDSEVISLYTDGYQPPATGIPKGDLEQSVQDTLDSVANKVDKEAGKGLSTEDFTAALKAKLEALDPYTKAEVDDKVANAGKVKSVSVNGTNHTPNSSGVVDLGTIQGTKGDKGEKGDTVVIDPEGLAQFEIANDLDTSDPTQGLSARQGKILKQAISTVQANLQAVVDALANMAFTSAKPTLSQIDWTGGTFYATINKTLSGCTATDNTNNGQIAEESTLTMTLTASSGFTLTGAIISVTNSRGQNVSYTLANNVLTIANVVGTINISVTAIGVFSVTNSDTHVDLTSQNMSPTTGSSWSGTLAIKSGVSGYGLAASPNVTMGGLSVDFSASGNSWNQSTGAMTIGSVTGDIVIVSASVEVETHNVTKKLLNMTSGNIGDTTDQNYGYLHNTIVDGSTYTDTILPVSGAASNNDLKVYMGGELLTANTDYTYNSSTGALSIPNVTGDITIVATAATGTITVRSNTSGTTATVGGTTITCDTADGNEFVGSASGITTFSSLSFSDKTKITAIDFGGAISTMNLYGSAGAFQGMTALVEVLGLVVHTTGTMRDVFNGCTKLERIQTIGWDLSHVSGTYKWYQTFMNCSKLARIDVDHFVDGFAGEVRAVFSGCSALTELYDINTWGMRAVTSMYMLFNSCSSLSTLDIRGWVTTSSLTGLGDAFKGIYKLIIGEFNTEGVNMGTTQVSNTIGMIQCTTPTPPAVNSTKAWLNNFYNLTKIIVPKDCLSAYTDAWGSIIPQTVTIEEES